MRSKKNRLKYKNYILQVDKVSKRKWKSKNKKLEKHLTLDSFFLGCDYSGQIAACVRFFLTNIKV